MVLTQVKFGLAWGKKSSIDDDTTWLCVDSDEFACRHEYRLDASDLDLLETMFSQIKKWLSHSGSLAWHMLHLVVPEDEQVMAFGEDKWALIVSDVKNLLNSIVILMSELD